MACSLIIKIVLCAILLTSVEASDDDLHPNLDKFVLIGKERTVPYDQFTGLPPGVCSTLKTLYLEYIQFDPKVLIDSLKACTEIRSISLFNVECMGRVTKKLTLPKLETFSFTMHQIQANSAEEFMAQLFFYNPDTDPVVPPSVTLLVGSNMTREFIRYDSSKRRLELEYVTYDLAKYFEYNELSFDHSHVELQALNFSNLTTLYLYNDHYDDDLFEVLRSAEKLIDLSIYQMWLYGIFQDLSVDLSIFPAISEFKVLVLQNARVGSTKQIALQSIGSLTLFNCELNTSLISISSSVYKLYLENVTFYRNSLDSFVSPMNNLTLVTLDYTVNENQQQFDIASLRNSSHTLEDLSFYRLNLQLSSPEVEFQNLTDVMFSDCEFSRNADGKLSRAFSSVTWLVVSECNISHTQLQELLMNPCVELFQFSRNEVEVPEIEKFLLESGVPASVKSPKMKKSNETSTGWSYIKNLSRLQNPALRDTALYTYVLVLLVICAIGIMGNILSGIVLTRKSMRSSTSCILLGLTICDCVILITYACSLVYFGIKLILVFLNFTISMDDSYHIFGFQVTGDLVARLDKFQYCFLYPLNKTAYTGSVYATILLTFERYIAVCWPFYVRRVLQVKTAVCSTILVLIIAVALNIPRWIEAHQYSSQVYFYVPNNYDITAYRADTLHFARNTLGSGLLRNRFYRQYYHGWLWVTLMYIIPISGLNFFNFKILAELKRSKQNRDSMTSAGQNKDHREMASLTKMLLCVILIFVICNSVSGVIVWSLIWYGGWDPSDIEVFSCIPLIINSSINFVIYALLGTKFRRELTRVIHGWVRCICRIELRQEAQNSICMSKYYDDY